MPDYERNQGTAITWTSTAGSETHALTLGSLGAGAAVNGDKGDLGATFADSWAVTLQIRTGTTAPTAGDTVAAYWAPSPASAQATDNPAGVDGSDGSYTGQNSDLATSLQNLQYLGSLSVVAATSTTIRRVFDGPLTPTLRYGTPVIVNNTTASLTSTSTLCFFILHPAPMSST